MLICTHIQFIYTTQAYAVLLVAPFVPPCLSYSKDATSLAWVVLVSLNELHLQLHPFHTPAYTHNMLMYQITAISRSIQDFLATDLQPRQRSRANTEEASDLQSAHEHSEDSNIQQSTLARALTSDSNQLNDWDIPDADVGSMAKGYSIPKAQQLDQVSPDVGEADNSIASVVAISQIVDWDNVAADTAEAVRLDNLEDLDEWEFPAGPALVWEDALHTLGNNTETSEISGEIMWDDDDWQLEIDLSTDPASIHSQPQSASESLLPRWVLPGSDSASSSFCNAHLLQALC